MEELPGRPARFQTLNAQLHPAVAAALAAAGAAQLFIHQATAIEAALAGRHTVVATTTASGKSLCYNVPVLQVRRLPDIYPSIAPACVAPRCGVIISFAIAYHHVGKGIGKQDACCHLRFLQLLF